MEKIRSKQTFLLTLLIITGVLLVTTAILFLINVENSILILILLPITLVLLIGFLYIKYKYDLATHSYQISRLLNSTEHDHKYKLNSFDQSFDTYLIQNKNYDLFYKDGNLSTFYKIGSGRTDKKRDTTLYSITILKDHTILFRSDLINKVLFNLENSLPKHTKYNKSIFYIFKTVDEFTQESIDDANFVYFKKERKFDIILINVLLSKKDQTIYFLHTKDYAPTPYYRFAIDELIKILES